VSSGGAPGDPAAQNSYRAPVTTPRGRGPRFWFAGWRVSGAKVDARPEQTFGPILFAQHTLGKGIMKMTAQMPPLGAGDSDTVRLQARDAAGAWKTIGEAHIHTLARTATFRIVNWEAARDVPYRLAYTLTTDEGPQERYWEGTVRRDPVDKESIVVAAFTGNKDTAFPNTGMVRNVAFHNPDVLVFTGDQIYEDAAGFGIETAPVEIAALDYLRKWVMLGWAWGGLMRDRVSISIPDDHDVYQGNIWGAGGRKISYEDHAQGGYRMPAEWVQMVERTQTSHLPDPYDPRPVEQGIGVYYGELRYGRIGFGILEDRKFKSGPEGLVPSTGGRPDHVTDPNFDRKAFDPPGAQLFGERQHEFIRNWVADWRETDMKVSITQTILANATTTHGQEMMRLVADLDSNGWPASARNRALRDLRRGFVFMIGGDQHLASIIHHGADDWSDSGYSFCVPSINTGYPRAWRPEKPGLDRAPGAPGHTGRHFDGLGNRLTIHAVGNPREQQRKTPLELLDDKASGYGIVRLDKRTGKISMECWRLLSDPEKEPASGQFPGWPMTIDIEDNYGRAAAAWLPELKISGMRNPVVQVIDEADGELVYALRIRGDSFRPKVFKPGRYAIRVGAPETDNFRTLRNVQAEAQPGKTLNVAF
jgi:alkaline phosphatase D